jgi:ATP synthase protein I
MMVDRESAEGVPIDSTPADTTPASSQPTDTGPATAPRKVSRRKARASRPVEDNAGWTVFGYMISGMVFYGAGGWLISRLTHISVLFPVGMLVGLALAIVLIIFRYGRA